MSDEKQYYWSLVVRNEDGEAIYSVRTQGTTSETLEEKLYQAERVVARDLSEEDDLL